MERFELGNLWCILTFDCRKGYEEVKKSIETRKEDFEQAKLILEESQVEEQVKEILTFPKITNSKQKTKEIREETARKELKEIFQKRRENVNKRNDEHKSREKEEIVTEQTIRASKQVTNSNSITV